MKTVPQQIASGAARRIHLGLKEKDTTATFELSGVEAYVTLGVLGRYHNSETSPVLHSRLSKVRKVLKALFGGNAVIAPMSDKTVTLSKLEAMALYLVLELFANEDL